MKKIISITLIIALVITTIIYFIPSRKYADSITENDLICLAAKSTAELNEYNFVDTVSARKALNDAINYINTLDGDINTIYTNLNTEMSNLKINDSSVSIPRTNTINKTYGLNVDTLIPVINEVEEMNKISEVEYNITWITGETVSTKDLFLYMYNYGIKSIEISLDNNIEDVEKICNYANSVGMSICIDGPINENLNKYNVFYKDGNVVDTKVEFTSDQEMINYIIYSINNNDCFYFNSASLITMSGTSNVIKAFNTVYLKYGTVDSSIPNNVSVNIINEDKINENISVIENTTENETNEEKISSNTEILNTTKTNVTISFKTQTNETFEDIVITKGSKLENIPVPTRNGYEFNGWYNGNTLLTKDLAINNDIVFMASWISIDYNITYILNGGTNNIYNINSTTKKAVSFYDPIKIGYTFEGWYLSKSFAGDKVTSLVVDKDITLYAKWSKNASTLFVFENSEKDKINVTKSENDSVAAPEKTYDISKNKWMFENNKWYYYDNNGIRETDCYRDGCWLNSDGSWDPTYSAGKWLCNITGWWYEDSSWYPVSQWIKIDGNWYYFDSSGYMVSNTWVGNYYLTQSGAMAVSTWIDEYYVGPDGAWIP